MLNIKRFAMTTLGESNNVRYRIHFTTCVKTLDETYRVCTIHKLNGMFHRDEDLPAQYWYDSIGVNQIWYKYGKIHRNGDQPAIIDSNGNKTWYWIGMRHRENDLPAMVCANGEQCWYVHGALHRDNGLPAIVTASGVKYWYYNGKEY
jgi:hypothetical protein